MPLRHCRRLPRSAPGRTARRARAHVAAAVAITLSMTAFTLLTTLPVGAQQDDAGNATAATLSSSAIVEATLYPESAQVTQTVRGALQDGALIFELPAQADPDTLRVEPMTEGYALQDVTWSKKSSETTQEPETLRTLREELRQVRMSLAETNGELEAVEARLAYWRNLPEFAPERAAELENAAAVMGREIAELSASRFPLEERRDRLTREEKRLATELEQITGEARAPWRVQAQLTPPAGGTAPAGDDISLTAVYTLGGCGWRPAYRLEARPGASHVGFTFEASLWQSSGADWRDVAIQLATVRPAAGLTPPTLPPWIIQERPEAKPMPRGGEAMLMRAPPSPDAQQTVAEAPPPREQRRATYSVWNLGRRDLPAGPPTRVALEEARWTADFLYTLRPARGEQAYLTAQVTLPETPDLPPGEALYLVDGAVIGKREFSLERRDPELFFGPSPLLVGSMRLTQRQAGDAGVISAKQTHLWRWEIEVINGANHAAHLRVEEPTPESRHEDIALEINSTPEAERAKDENLLVWEKTLDPGAEWIIQHEVKIVAPKAMALDLGWR